MAKYNITYSCGHTETVQIYGTNAHGEREKKAAWLAANHVCSACLKADREAAKAAAAERAKANGMTEGCDKLLAWAADIIEEAAKHVDARRVAEAFQAKHADKLPALLSLGKEKAPKLVADAIESAMAKTWTLPAKAIIDHRFDLAAQIAAGAARRVAEAL